MSSLPLLAFSAAFLALPLVPALRELYRPTDDKPLHVNQGNAADLREVLLPVHQYVRENPTATAQELLERHGAWAGSAREWANFKPPATLRTVEVTGAVHLDECPAGLELVFASSLVLGASLKSDVPFLASDCITVAPGAIFRKAQAPEIRVGPCAGAGREPESAESRSAACVQGCTWHELQGWWHGARSAQFENGLVQGDIVVAGDLALGDGVVVLGSVKAGGAVHLGRGSEVHGNCVASTVHMLPDSLVRGSVVADGSVQMAAGSQVGTPSTQSSVVAQLAHLESGARIFGAVVTHRCAVAA